MGIPVGVGYVSSSISNVAVMLCRLSKTLMHELECMGKCFFLNFLFPKTNSPDKNVPFVTAPVVLDVIDVRVLD